MRWTAVVNPTAGRGRTRKLLPRLVDALAGTDLDVDVRVSEDLDDAIRIGSATRSTTGEAWPPVAGTER